MFLVDKNQMKFMYSYLKMQRKQLILLLLLIGVTLFFQIYNPQYIKSFIDDAKAGQGQSVLMMSATLFLLFSLLRQLITIVIQYVTSDLTWKVTNKLRYDLTERRLSYDLSFHNDHTPGEMVDRIDGDVGRLNNYLSTFALKVLSNNLLIISIIVVIFFIHPAIGAVVTVTVLFGLYVLNKMSRFGSNNIHNYLAEAAHYIGFIDERIAGREDIRALNAEQHVLNKFYARLKTIYRIRKKTGFNIATVVNAGEIVLGLILVSTIFAMGYIFLKDGSLTLGTMVLVYFYITILLVPLRSIVMEVSDLQHVKAALIRINELLDYENKVTDSGTRVINEEGLSIEFQNVSFSYTEGNMVLKNVSFDIPTNKMVGVIGRTGSGKTTLARLIYRLCDPREGTISVNGINLNQYRLDDLRKHIAIISQNIELFEGTLRENITMFKEEIEDRVLWDIINKLSLKDWISKTPEGLDRKIERDGKNLSAGEAQLIAFARAFLKKPKIVIMDEATSRIDPLTERVIERAIVSLTKNVTTIIIAHRLSTISLTDYLLVMQHGEVIEFGETAKLEQEHRSVYRRMMEKGEQANA
jgi:ATP-binding cassette, subfamily B, bacterial